MSSAKPEGLETSAVKRCLTWSFGISKETVLSVASKTVLGIFGVFSVVLLIMSKADVADENSVDVLLLSVSGDFEILV